MMSWIKYIVTRFKNLVTGSNRFDTKPPSPSYDLSWRAEEDDAFRQSSDTKPLFPSYELAWRTEEDTAFRHSSAWKQIRLRILNRDDYTCAYCGYRAEKYQHVHHIDGNPKNNDDTNLEVICPDCHKVMHSGLWCSVKKTMILFESSKYVQTDIIRITREMRSQGKSDDEIIDYLGLKNRVPWIPDLEYLKPLYAFITSAPERKSSKRYLSEDEQKYQLMNRDKW